MKINWKRGLFRLWLVATLVWLGFVTYAAGNRLTAVMENVPPGVDRLGCPLAQIRPDMPNPCQWPMVPDWNKRLETAIAMIVVPIVVPILGFALFWAGWLAIKIAKWITQGFRA